MYRGLNNIEDPIEPWRISSAFPMCPVPAVKCLWGNMARLWQLTILTWNQMQPLTMLTLDRGMPIKTYRRRSKTRVTYVCTCVCVCQNVLWVWGGFYKLEILKTQSHSATTNVLAKGMGWYHCRGKLWATLGPRQRPPSRSRRVSFPDRGLCLWNGIKKIKRKRVGHLKCYPCPKGKGRQEGRGDIRRQARETEL